MQPDDEEELLRSVALQNARSILLARERAEEELRRANEALARSVVMMRATLESTWDGILVTDQRGMVTDFNQRYVDMWQVPAALMDSRDHRAIVTHAASLVTDAPGYLARIDVITAATPDESFDVLELADGRVLERYSRTQSVEGRNVGRVWSFRDITASRRAEEALREETHLLGLLNRTGTALSSELSVRALVQAVTDATTEISGAEFGAFFYNVADPHGDAYMLYALSGAPREAFDTFGQPRATPLFEPTFRGAGPIRCDDVRQDPRYGLMEPHRGMPAGHLPVCSYLAVPVISRSGAVIGGLFFGHSRRGVFTERSERVVVALAAQAAVALDNARLYEAAQQATAERQDLLEREQAARAELERASSLKDDFLATLSHELRTPLTAILGWSSILRGRAMGEGERRQGLQVIERNARVQAQLIDDLLDINRITSGRLRLDVQPIDPVAIVEAAVETVRPAAEAKSVRLHVLLDPAAGPITGDPNRLQQIVWNLLSNAVKFTGRDGRVDVVLARVNSHIEITVADTGVGIRPDFLPHVFDRFWQGHPRARGTPGLGLGLAIVKSLVELHGGAVRVTSPGEKQGATFTIHLPRAVVDREPSDDTRVHPTVPRTTAADVVYANLAGIKILVVDDQEDACALIKTLLVGCRADVVVASHAEEALSVMVAERPDLLLSDIGLPGVDGYELLRRVRSLGHERGGRIPAIALTALARSEDRTRALRAGFLVHVAKPVDPSELIATVASVMGRAGEPTLGESAV